MEAAQEGRGDDEPTREPAQHAQTTNSHAGQAPPQPPEPRDPAEPLSEAPRGLAPKFATLPAALMELVAAGIVTVHMRGVESAEPLVYVIAFVLALFFLALQHSFAANRRRLGLCVSLGLGLPLSAALCLALWDHYTARLVWVGGGFAQTQESPIILFAIFCVVIGWLALPLWAAADLAWRALQRRTPTSNA
jgi:hypothetical protein